LPDRERVAEFERVALPHARSAFELARWLTRDAHDAEDVVQEAFLRALKYFDAFGGTDARTWLLAIVRNTFYTWHSKRSARESDVPLTEGGALADSAEGELADPTQQGPEVELDRASDRSAVDRALRALPLEFREVIVLRELEELSYKEIAAVAQIPLGTVMSRLARGREHLRRLLAHDVSEEVPR